MNTFELNKIAGAVLGTVLLIMSLGIVADYLYSSPKPDVPGYKVELPDAASGGQDTAAESEPQVTLAAMLAGADAGKGASQAKKCAACHTMNDGGANKVGPNLFGIVGRQMAAIAGFNYSAAMKASATDGGVWTYEVLNDFLANPKGYLSGTSMAFAGVKRDNQRADLVLFLKEQSPDAPDLPVDEAMAAPAAEMAPAPEAEAPMTEPATPETPAEAETPASTEGGASSETAN